MPAFVEYNLALILFLPWLAILCVLFWRVPRQPRHAARRAFDTVALLLCLAAFVAAMVIGQDRADASGGHVWRQIVAAAAAYTAFLVALALMFAVRSRWLRRG